MYMLHLQVLLFDPELLENVKQELYNVTKLVKLIQQIHAWNLK